MKFFTMCMRVVSTIVFVLSEILEFITGLTTRKNKFFSALGFFTLAYTAGVINPGPAMSYDYPLYATFYNAGSNYFEKGYSDFALFALQHGLSYEEFRYIFSIIAIVILYWGVARFTNNMALFISLYGCTVFFYDAVQIRNLMMISLVILGSSFLIDLSIKNIAISTALILFSAQFHTSGYFFLLIILVRILPKKIIKRSLYVVICVTILLTVIVSFTGTEVLTTLLTKPLNLIIGGRASLGDKLVGQYNYGSPVPKLITIIISTTCALIVQNMYFTSSGSNEEFKKQQILFSAMITAVLGLPLLLLAIDYSRIQRNAVLFILIGISLFFEQDKVEFKKNKISIVMWSVFVFALNVWAQIYIWGFQFQEIIPYLIKVK